MPHHPAARPPRTDPVPGRPAPAGRRPVPPPVPDRPRPDATATDVVTVGPPARDLTVNKVLAGAGAAATSAVLGSFFGAAGTVAGAALGSVASTVAATVYQRYLDRTRDTIVARIRPVAGGDSAGELTLPMQRTGEDETVRLRVEPVVPPAPTRRRWWPWVGATVLVFVIGLLAVTGLEWVKGSTLTSNDSGTSVGRVLGGDRNAPTEPDPVPSTPTEGSTSDATPEPTVAPSSTAVPERGGSGATDPSGVPATDAPSTGTPGATDPPGRSGLLDGLPG